jgi:hypothetical protein
MPKLHADKKLHYAYGHREPAEGPNLLHRFSEVIRIMARC